MTAEVRAAEMTPAAEAKVETKANSISEEKKDHLWQKRHEALYRCSLSTLYHRKRERFFEGCDRLTKAIAILSGSVAFGLVAHPFVTQIATSVVAITAALSLVIGYAEKARRHAALAEKFKYAEADILSIGEYNFTEEDINRWYAKIAQIEAGEPLTLPIIILMCENELHIAAKSKVFVKIPAWKRWLGQVFYIDMSEKDKTESMPA